jgi:nucleotide-binding universal stress UspA family protein
MEPEAEHALAGLLEEARAICPGAEVELLRGARAPRLLTLVEETCATLLAVAPGGHRRGVGIIRRDLATELMHRSPASVLIARASRFPGMDLGSLVVGWDASPASTAALAVARDLADRLGASLRVVVAGNASSAQLEPAWLTVERGERPAVDALLAASADADLLIVGSRGPRGLRALGSVSERLGHKAQCSVLIVRDR